MKNDFKDAFCDIFMNNYSTVSKSTINSSLWCQHLRGENEYTQKVNYNSTQLLALKITNIQEECTQISR